MEIPEAKRDHARRIAEAVAQAKTALAGDSNDAEHDALFALIEVLDNPPVKALFSVHEIEHQSDEQSSLEDLKKAGCTDILVLSRAYLEGDGDDESMGVECYLPYGIKTKTELESKLEFACL
jgi:hypothetical protein